MAAVADMNLLTPRPSLSMERDIVVNGTTNNSIVNGSGGSGLLNGRSSHKSSASDGISSSASAILGATGSGSTSASTSSTVSPQTSSTLVNGSMPTLNDTSGAAPPQPTPSIMAFPELEGKQPDEQLGILKDMYEKTSRVKEGAETFLRITPNLSVRCHSYVHHSRLRCGVPGILTVHHFRTPFEGGLLTNSTRQRASWRSSGPNSRAVRPVFPF